jgi:hypothetical protein
MGPLAHQFFAHDVLPSATSSVLGLCVDTSQTRFS